MYVRVDSFKKWATAPVTGDIFDNSGKRKGD
ncbi:hypothetical protein IM043_gp219 [Bacillus phage SPG24]|nr:hypothetical protein IM043_gp219 [Bacillus phage SPG24]